MQPLKSFWEGFRLCLRPPETTATTVREFLEYVIEIECVNRAFQVE